MVSMGGSTAVANSQDMAISHVAATGRGTDTGALRHLDNTPGNRLRRKNRVGQPLSHQRWQDGGVKTENMKTEVRSQESEWGRPRAMLASSQRCRRPAAEGIQSTE